MTEHLAFYEQFPLLVPEALDPLRVKGFIDVNGNLVEMQIDATGASTYSTEIIHSTNDITEYLHSQRASLNVRFQQCTSALTFMQELHRALQPFTAPSRSNDPAAYKRIVDFMDTIGWGHAIGFADDKLTLAIHDQAGRTHEVIADFVKGQVSSSIEAGETTISVDLARYIGGLKQKCVLMSECWAVLDDTDASLSVLVPDRPRRYDLWRRISIGDLLTGHLVVSADRPVPKLTVYGPKGRAEELNAKAKNMRNLWDPRRSVRDNLEEILQVELPHKGEEAGEANIQCGICFAFMNGDECADQTCSNDHCVQPFHRQCLMKWLTTKEDTRQSYDTYFGKCPYCSSNIAVAGSKA